jgi:hypothetical protein
MTILERQLVTVTDPLMVRVPEKNVKKINKK